MMGIKWLNGLSMDKIICPRCDCLITMGGDIGVSWLLEDHVKNLCTPDKKYQPKFITTCCGSKHWDSDEDGYRCSACYEIGSLRKYFLKENPNWKK
jgi:hypothetical protein